jgi:hypothetical protein
VSDQHNFDFCLDQKIVPEPLAKTNFGSVTLSLINIIFCLLSGPENGSRTIGSNPTFVLPLSVSDQYYFVSYQDQKMVPEPLHQAQLWFSNSQYLINIFFSFIRTRKWFQNHYTKPNFGSATLSPETIAHQLYDYLMFAKV